MYIHIYTHHCVCAYVTGSSCRLRLLKRSLRQLQFLARQWLWFDTKHTKHTPNYICGSICGTHQRLRNQMYTYMQFIIINCGNGNLDLSSCVGSEECLLVLGIIYSHLHTHTHTWQGLWYTRKIKALHWHSTETIYFTAWQISDAGVAVDKFHKLKSYQQ